MKEAFDDLQQELNENRKGKPLFYFDEFFEDLFEDFDSFKKFEVKYHCTVSVSKEKHNELQYTYYFDIYSDLIDGELFLEIESGINNGTQLLDYSFGENLLPKSRTVEVLKDIVLDEEKTKKLGFSVLKAKAVLSRHKAEILKLIRNQSYDNYVTGGGTNKTDEYYQDKFNSFENMGLFWTEVYEDMEADINLV